MKRQIVACGYAWYHLRQGRQPSRLSSSADWRQV